MSLTMLIGLFGGLGMFIYGMHLMSEGLKIVAGNKMRHFLEILTNTPLKALLCGIIVTIMVQSSSTTTVMVVGFVNASLMTLTQATGIILGSNVGTTIMAQIIAFDITSYTPILIGLGVFIALFAKRQKFRDWGTIVLGLGILFFGITTMSASVRPLNDSPEFIDLLLTYGKNPFYGLLASAIMTAILQSSGAIIGLVQALAISGVFASTTGTEAIQICIPLVIGSNIGTCITALLSAIGTSNTAKDAAYIHLFINVFGAIWVLPLLLIMDSTMPVNPIYEFIVRISGDTVINGSVVPNVARQIAMAHTIFNIVNTVVLFPFTNLMVKVVEKIFPPEPPEEGVHLDNRLLNTPEIAIDRAEKELIKLGSLCRKNFIRSMEALITFDTEKIDKVKEVEDRINEYENEIQEYAAHISNLSISTDQSYKLVRMVENTHYFESISDHIVMLTNLAQEMISKESHFSNGMIESLKDLEGRTLKILEQVNIILEDPTNNALRTLYKEESYIDQIILQIRENRIENLTGTNKKVFSTFIFIDVLTNIERINELAENIANSYLNNPAQNATSTGLEEIVY